jgi:hypothetical protein
MRARKNLKEAVKRDGIDAVNSDEEQRGILDEVQQDKFINAMNDMASDYIRSWKRMFAWLCIIIIYINILALTGFLSPARSVFSAWVPRSFTVQSLLSPIWAGEGFFKHAWPFYLQLLSLVAILHIARASFSGSPTPLRVMGVLSLVAWLGTSYLYIDNWLWGRHTVLVASLPLLCIGAETFVSARDLAVQGIGKLSALRYSHKKV